MKKMVKFISLFLVLISMFSTQFVTSVSAATTTGYYKCDKTVTMTVKTTKKNATMKLNCKAASYADKFGVGIKFTKKHTCKVAPKMVIEVSPRINGKSVYYLQGSGKSISSTLKFGEAGTYTVTVKYLYNGCNKCNASNYEFYHSGLLGSDYCDGTWKVSSSKNVNITRIRVR